MNYEQFICVTADNLFQEEEKIQNYMETHVFVRNNGDSVSIEPICRNSWGGRYDVFGCAIRIPMSLIPEEFRASLPPVGDWHDVSLFEGEEED